MRTCHKIVSKTCLLNKQKNKQQRQDVMEMCVSRDVINELIFFIYSKRSNFTTHTGLKWHLEVLFLPTIPVLDMNICLLV
jgi:hypothetical protein